MIKAAVVLLAAWLIVPRLRSRSAAERHLLWAAAMAAAALLPALGAALPIWDPEWARNVSGRLPLSFETVSRWLSPSGDDVVVRATGLEPAGWAMTGALLIWVAGTMLALVPLAVRWLELRRLVAAADPVIDARIQGVAADAARALGLTRPAVLLQSSRITIPVTCGIRCPAILLPMASAAWPGASIVAIVTHEMAHVRRGDWAVHMLAEIACGIYWFNPFFWIARTHLRRESERAADDVVVRGGMDTRDYARLLVQIVRTARATPPAAALAMARASDLVVRVESLLDESTNRVMPSRTAFAMLLTAVVLAAVPLAALATPGLAAYVQVRSARVPAALFTAIPRAQEGASAPVRNIRVVMPAGARADLVSPEVVEYTTPPLYSDEARARRVQGIVVIGARIDAGGRVEDARVLRGLGYGLDQNALVAFRQWRLRPGTSGGVRTAVDVEVEIEFSLAQEALNELIANDMATQVGPGVTPPRAVLSAQPQRGLGAGRVVLDVVLLEDGRPRVVRVINSASPALDDAALRTFSRWRFTPALKDGLPVKVRMTAEVNFHG